MDPRGPSYDKREMPDLTWAELSEVLRTHVGRLYQIGLCDLEDDFFSVRETLYSIPACDSTGPQPADAWKAAEKDMEKLNDTLVEELYGPRNRSMASRGAAMRRPLNRIIKIVGKENASLPIAGVKAASAACKTGNSQEARFGYFKPGEAVAGEAAGEDSEDSTAGPARAERSSNSEDIVEGGVTSGACSAGAEPSTTEDDTMAGESRIAKGVHEDDILSVEKSAGDVKAEGNGNCQGDDGEREHKYGVKASAATKRGGSI